MILLGTSYGKTLIFWTETDQIEIRMRGPSGKLDWVETFVLEEAQRFFLAGAVEIGERLRQRDIARQPAPAAVSAP